MSTSGAPRARPKSSILAGIAHWAALVPASPAVVHGPTVITYAELESRSNQLSVALRGLGAGVETCIALCLERSPDFVVAALAVLKAGAAYLPLDPQTPAERAGFILSDSGSRLLLTHQGCASDWPTGPWRVVDLAAFSPPGVDPERAEPARPEPEPSGLAYIIYTSGSTGRPKGVEITHANLANLVDWHVQSFGVTAVDRASQVAGLGFDAAVWEIWPHLAAGCQVHFADELVRRSPSALRDWLISAGITISFAPTVLAEQLLSLDWPAETSLRTLLTGADTLNVRPRGELPFGLVNNYGPTECTVVATSGVVAGSSETNGRPTIGRPISGATAYILDDSMRVVAPGEPGELCIAGALVGRGYRNNPGLTARSFVSVDLRRDGEIRVYRTGDRVRELDNGEIEFLGRTDDQVKVRGYRVELGEVRAWLGRYPGVDSCVVTMREDAHGVNDADLVGYLVLAEGVHPSANEIRQFLSARLPDYMLPTCFVALGSFPVTLNGKIDFTALPAPAEDNLLVENAATPSASGYDEVTEKVGALVATLLRRTEVGVDDNIFLLGGHSMLGVQLMTRIRQTFGVGLTLRKLFSGPTVAVISAEVGRQLSEVGSTPVAST
jgi:amino acid adenylation domain-containing protein